MKLLLIFIILKKNIKMQTVAQSLVLFNFTEFVKIIQIINSIFEKTFKFESYEHLLCRLFQYH